MPPLSAALAVLGTAIVAGFLTGTAIAAPADSDGIAVSVRREGPVIVVDVDMQVDATPQQAWDVLTDYDHMARFVSSLTTSRIESRAGNTLEVAQHSHVGIGLIKIELDNVRRVELVPLREIRSTLVRGDMRASAFTTRLEPVANSTRITNHGRFIPDRWVPPLIGPAVMESQTRSQFAEIRTEILRRKAAGSGARK